MICKWNVEVSSKPQTIGSGPVLMVGWQETDGWVQVWTDEPGDSPERDRSVYVYGTGDTPKPGQQHLGSVITGSFVWHLYAARGEDVTV